MTDNMVIADKVRVTFSDNTHTTIAVDADASIQDAIAQMCDLEGWDLDEVTGYRITGQVTEEQIHMAMALV